MAQYPAETRPHVAAWADAVPLAALPSGPAATPYLQAMSIWFQLLRLVDENTALRSRRLTETQDGPGAVKGGFSEVLAAQSFSPAQLENMIEEVSVGPTLTAHPTEAKRVTVLEIHRRIYRALVSLGRSAGPPPNALNC
ncbi:phosphoenolpyruvate carboxylase [Parasedimentitalea marina]|uniref:phosphoenolpyruvate carboxylase n=1 Tax=Parasedimentitalea marina TaxID=2483033 RepID=UPI00237AE543|nr:phosphoenolpyruvate carboxylase [Parasedimentitalea marina]